MKTSNFANWKEELRYLKLNDSFKKYPNAFMASGGWEQKPKPYSDTNTNGLTKAVHDFLTFHGHYVIRTPRQGQARVEYLPKNPLVFGKGKYDKKISWTKSSEGKAITDLQATIYGLAVAIEIKCKATRDTIKDNQLENKRLVEQAGGIHLFITCMDDLWLWYHNDLPRILKSKIK